MRGEFGISTELKLSSSLQAPHAGVIETQVSSPQIQPGHGLEFMA